MRKIIIGAVILVMASGFLLSKVLAAKGGLNDIDKDYDGVWDDVQADIEKRFGDSKMARAQKQSARATQKLLENPEKWNELQDDFWKAFSCVEALNKDRDEEVTYFIENHLSNNPARARRYIDFQANSSGHMLRPLAESEKNCE
jgi:hypothetical protein